MQKNLSETKEFIDLGLLKRNKTQQLVLTWRGYYYAIKEKIRQIRFIDDKNIGNKLILAGRASRIFIKESRLSFKNRTLQSFYLNYFQIGKIKRNRICMDGISNIFK